MDDLIYKLGWKKVVAILVAACVLGFIYVIFSMQQFSNPKNQENLDKVYKNNSASGTSNNKILSNTKIASTPYFQLSYPGSYTSSQQNGDAETLSTLRLNDSESNAVVDIQAFSISTNSVANLARIFESFKYTMTTYSTTNYPRATEYAGIMAGTSPLGHEKAVFIEKNDTIIKAILIYYQNTENQKVEKDFKDIVNSIK